MPPIEENQEQESTEQVDHDFNFSSESKNTEIESESIIGVVDDTTKFISEIERKRNWSSLLQLQFKKLFENFDHKNNGMQLIS